MYQGSGDKQMNDDDDMMMDYSGKGENDEDGKGDMERDDDEQVGDWEEEMGSAGQYNSHLCIFSTHILLEQCKT